MNTALDTPAICGAVGDDFRALLKSFDLDALDRRKATIYGIRRDGTLAYVNGTWMQFARDNNAPEWMTDPGAVLDRPIREFLAGPMIEFYETIFEYVIDSRAPYRHEYECSSPREFRIYRADILPLPAPEVDPRGLLIVNSPVSSSPLDPEESSPELEDYLTDDELLISCSNCRRFRHKRHSNRWDWIPEYLEDSPAEISHGLCTICLDYYHPESPTT